MHAYYSLFKFTILRILHNLFIQYQTACCHPPHYVHYITYTQEFSTDDGMKDEGEYNIVCQY